MYVNDDRKKRKWTDTLFLYKNHRILEYHRIGNYKCMLSVIDCTHSNEHDNDH